MAIIERTSVIGEAEAAPEFYSAGAPAAGDYNGEAAKGCLLKDTTNGVLYINTGTKAATIWTVVGAQV